MGRGPFEGNTEVTLHGNHFLPSWHLQCQLQDPLTGAKLFVPGHYDTARRIRCVTPRVEPLPGGEKLATIRPCFYKYFSASSSAGPWERWSTASAAVRFLYCDVYVATDGRARRGEVLVEAGPDGGQLLPPEWSPCQGGRSWPP